MLKAKESHYTGDILMNLMNTQISLLGQDKQSNKNQTNK